MNNQLPDEYKSYKALAMRLEGMTYRKIGEALGVSRQRAYQLAERAAVWISDGEGDIQRVLPKGAHPDRVTDLLMTFTPGYQKPHFRRPEVNG